MVSRTISQVISAERAADAISANVIWSRGRFRLRVSQKKGSVPYREIQQKVILLPFIEGIHEHWPFDPDPSPRVTGQLIELLRGCRFVENENSELQILPDREYARNLGAFDTPQVVVDFIVNAVVRPICGGGTPPLVLDPACGAGYFINAAIDVLIEKYPDHNPSDLARDSVRGFDVDEVAVDLTKRNLRWHLEHSHNTAVADTTLDQVILKADALADIEELPVYASEVDGVVGNPPYQFFSGRGSPVAALRRIGNFDEAESLQKELDELTARFPQTSHGCRDRYKWFVNRAVELIREGGMLGFITPNTWIQYPRYHDLRGLLSGKGHFESVIDLGSLAFRQAHVPASVIIWRKSRSGSGEFPFLGLDRETWQEASDGNIRVIPDALDNAPIFRIDSRGEFAESSGSKSWILEKSAHIAKLGDIAVLREGSHAIGAIPIDCPGQPAGGRDFPVLVDKSMDSLVLPRIGYIAEPQKSIRNTDIHRGRRFLIRKTGDRLTVAPSPTDDFALVHQNVYSGKLLSKAIPFLALVGILASDLMTRLYRTGPGGQHHRPLAQLRILFLKELPIVVIPDEWKDAPETSTEEIDALIISLLNEKSGNIEPVPREFPSEEINARKTARLIRLYHGAIAELVERHINTPDENLKHALDILVYHLYGCPSEK